AQGGRGSGDQTRRRGGGCRAGSVGPAGQPGPAAAAGILRAQRVGGGALPRRHAARDVRLRVHRPDRARVFGARCQRRDVQPVLAAALQPAPLRLVLGLHRVAAQQASRGTPPARNSPPAGLESGAASGGGRPRRQCPGPGPGHGPGARLLGRGRLGAAPRRARVGRGRLRRLLPRSSSRLGLGPPSADGPPGFAGRRVGRGAARS
ncbi:hypothetical protein H632_c5158p0, partial [Helicosporidium sp. ATCC 50920]